MATTPESDLPLNLNLADGNSPRGRRWFHKRYLLVLLIPVFMFLGGVMGMYFQPVPIQKFYALTGLHTREGHTVFFENGAEIGRIKDSEFSKRFFDIWLHEKTSAPDLRRKLLGMS